MMVSKVKNREEFNPHDDDKTYELFKIFGRLYNIRIIRALQKQPQRYKELMSLVATKTRPNTTIFAFYIRQLRENNIVSLDPKTTQYFLTFKGLKMAELVESVDKIANISIENMDNINTKLTIDLNKNRTWLEPLIKAEIKHAVKELIGN